MRFIVGDLTIELAPLTREAMSEYVNLAHGGGMQRFSVFKYLGRDTAPVLEDEQEWFDKARQAIDTLLWGIWIVAGDTRTLIGGTSLFDIDKSGHSKLFRQAVSGYMVFRTDFHGLGIATAAHKARTWYAFQQMGLHRIASQVIQANAWSRKALLHSGYRKLYTERNEQYTDGRLHHLDNFECLNPLDFFWSQWWHGDTPPKAALEARERTLEALAWAEENVELL